MPRKTIWDEAEIARLKQLVAAGASAFRASVALKRPRMSVLKKARDIGTPFETVQETRRRVRAATTPGPDQRKP